VYTWLTSIYPYCNYRLQPAFDYISHENIFSVPNLGSKKLPSIKALSVICQVLLFFNWEFFRHHLSSVVTVSEFTLLIGFGRFFKKKTVVRVLVLVFDEWLSLLFKNISGFSVNVYGRVRGDVWSPDGLRRVKRITESDTDKTKALWGVFEEILVHGQVTIIFIVSVCLFVCAVFLSRL